MVRLLVFLCVVAWPTYAEVRLDHLTTVEVSEAIDAGFDTVIIPTGGTEQNGAHMVLGKHNLRVAHLGARIAETAGRTLVAPVLAYVPEGRIDPPEGHMRFAGTISVPEEVFALTVEYAARSLYQAGFRHIILIGDSGGNQRALAQVEQKLNKEWWGSPVLYADAYYGAHKEFVRLLQDEGYSEAKGGHAGLADTSLLMGVAPQTVRDPSMNHDGQDGRADRASAALGQIGLDLFIDRTVQQIHAFRGD